MEMRGGPGADFITILGSAQGVVQIACACGSVNNKNGPKLETSVGYRGFLFLHD